MPISSARAHNVVSQLTPQLAIPSICEFVTLEFATMRSVRSSVRRTVGAALFTAAVGCLALCPPPHRPSTVAADMAGGTAVAAAGMAAVAGRRWRRLAWRWRRLGLARRRLGCCWNGGVYIGVPPYYVPPPYYSPARVLSASLLPATLRVRLLKRPCAAPGPRVCCRRHRPIRCPPSPE